MNRKSVYLIEFNCKGAKPGRSVVVAKNGHEALEVFFGHWDSDFEAGEVDIPKNKLENFKIESWSDNQEVLFED